MRRKPWAPRDPFDVGHLNAAGRRFVEAARETVVERDPQGRTVWQLLGEVLPKDVQRVEAAMKVPSWRDDPDLPEDVVRL